MKKRATESSSKTPDPTPFSGSICWGPLDMYLHLTSLHRTSDCLSRDLLRRRSGALLCERHVTATLYRRLLTFTWLTRYNIMLKMQTLRDSCIITNCYFVLEMEMVSAFKHQFSINVFLKEAKI